MKKFTAINIPAQLKTAVYEMLEVTGQPLFYFENKAVEEFLDKNQKVDDKFKHRKYDANYIKREERLPLYLEQSLLERIAEYKKVEKVTKTNIALQALENACLKYAKEYSIELKFDYWSNHEL